MITNDNHIKQLLLNAAVTPPERVWVLVSDALNELKTDNLLKQNLLSAELTPPDAVWQKMTERFDEETADRTISLKINEAEIKAPSFVWDAISTELDNEVFAQKLNEAAVAPPVSIWDSISAELDNEAFAQKLTEAAVAPPFAMWDKIDAALDAEVNEQLKEKLIHAEVLPHAASWNYIEQQIHATEGAKVIPFKSRVAPLYKLAAAAVITGVMAWGAYQLFSTGESTTNQPAIAQTTTPEVKPAETSTTTPVIIPQPQQPSSVATAKKAAKKGPTKQNRVTVQQQDPLPNNVAVAEAVSHSSETILPHRDVHHKKNTSAFTGTAVPENQYMLVLNDNGDLIRVSKKIATMKCANGSGELPVDAVAALQTRDCDDQIKRWQQKIAMSALVSPNSGYIDMNELILTTEK